MSQPLQFHGQYKDSVLGLYDMRQRDYNPVTGMFFATDPIPVAVGDPFISRYSYGFNNPLVFTDASGLEPRAWKDGSIVGVPGVASVSAAVAKAATKAASASKPSPKPRSTQNPGPTLEQQFIDAAPTCEELGLPESPVQKLDTSADMPWRESWNKYAGEYLEGRKALTEAVLGEGALGSDGKIHYPLLNTVPNNVDTTEADFLLNVYDAYAGVHEFDELTGNDDYINDTEIFAQIGALYQRGNTLQALLTTGTVVHVTDNLLDFATSRFGRAPKPRK
jgi:RHS repeat-associated protein